jgi:hypothetical protein
VVRRSVNKNPNYRTGGLWEVIPKERDEEKRDLRITQVVYCEEIK